ncbi:MAG: chorismate mutase [Firmicutes bacterium]|nr:chorismate mutase [Bacillota bacterium]
MRGVRGATTVDRDDPEEILSRTAELLCEIQRVNGILPGDIAGIIFTMTPDLTKAFPAAAARRLGWNLVPLIDAVEPVISGAPGRCIRALLLWNTDKTQNEIKHVYLRGASGLRPDLGQCEPGD